MVKIMIIDSVVRNEALRNNEMIQQYENLLSNLPKGSLICRNMILYHGSTDLVDKPEIRKSDVYLDFGVGFYTTTSFEQAERWAKIKMRRKKWRYSIS